MAFNRRNLLLKIIEIQEIVLEHQKKGVSQRWVYRHLVRDRYFISERTFEEYLSRNAKKELADYDRKVEEAKKTKQLEIDF